MSRRLAQESSQQIASLSSQIAELESSLSSAVLSSRQWEDKAREWYTAKRAAEKTVAELVAKVETAATDARIANRLLESAQKSHDRLLEIVSELHRQLSRQPEVVVESILTGIAPLFIGYQQDTDATKSQGAVQTAMGSLGLDNMADTRGYFPDIEFDETMEDRSAWPTPANEMSATTLPGSKTSTAIDSDHAMTGNGMVQRPDGQQMFTSGSGLTSPPGNETE